MNHRTLGQIFLKRCEKGQGQHSVGHVVDSKLQLLTYDTYLTQIQTAAIGLKEILKLKPGDTLAIMAVTSLEWHIIDLAAMSIGLIVVPLYPGLTAKEAQEILLNSQSKKIIFGSSTLFFKLQGVLDESYQFGLINSSSTPIDSKQCLFGSFDIFMKASKSARKLSDVSFKDLVAKVRPDDTASIVYTSGTTGGAKGAIITHRAFSAMLSNLVNSLQGSIFSHDRTLAFLPLAHVLGRCDSLLNLAFGLQTVFIEGPERLGPALPIVNPTIFIAVPRVLEKIHDRIRHKIQSLPTAKAAYVRWAFKTSEQYFRALGQDQSPGRWLCIQEEVARKVINKLMSGVFGTKLRFIVSGGAPLLDRTTLFYKNLGLVVLEGYGLTETVGPVIINRPSKQYTGHVGSPLGDVSIALAEDNELLIKSASLFSGYNNLPQETDQTLRESTLYTGDLAQLSPSGQIKIIGRKKEIIVTSSGKNISPLKVEQLIAQVPFIQAIVVVGDGRKYLTGIVFPNFEKLVPYLKSAYQMTETSRRELCQMELVRELILEEIHRENQELASYEQVKNVVLTSKDLTTASGLLTPSLKIKRQEVERIFSEEIEQMY